MGCVLEGGSGIYNVRFGYVGAQAVIQLKTKDCIHTYRGSITGMAYFKWTFIICVCT